ncbi:MAG: nuclear transport factor 2 family protein [Halieaceae bacterium]|jgi:hypothetical protein|nr:nuclear transport factor 2 family protein [Halieaceae bacterium]
MKPQRAHGDLDATAAPTLARWHEIALSQDAAGLPDILSENCVFLSPVVHTPQAGRDITVLYLTGAMQVFNESFHYTREVLGGHDAMLEFECTVDGILINGIDIISFGDDGLIEEFRVMVRPLKAMQLLHGKMAVMLEQLKAGAH